MHRANVATVRIAGLTIFSLLLFGCGGGGGGTAATPPPVLSNDASLSSLSVTGVTLAPAFSTAVTSYTGTVPNSTDSVDVAATSSDSSASFTINGGNNGTVALTVGDNTISIVVTAENGTTTSTYTIVVTRAALNNDASLASLSLSVGALAPVFDTAVINYAATVLFGTNSVDVAATTTDVNASLTINGGSNATVALAGGDNTISIVVTAEDGTTTSTYTVIVTRPVFNNDASLASLSLSDGTLDPVFDSATTDYIATVPFGTSSVDVSAATSDANASFTINGGNNAAVAMGIGDNTITIVVTAEDGTTTRTYTVVVTRLNLVQEAYIKATNTESSDFFGFLGAALSADGNTLAVSAMDEDGGAVGVNGDATDNSEFRAGAVYVYARDGAGTWMEQAYVKASNTETLDRFGWNMALSGDGDTLAVATSQEDSAATGVNGDDTDNTAFSSGAVYVFTRDTGGVWTQQAYVKASNAEQSDQFGETVALSGDGNMLAVGAIGEASTATGVNGDQTSNSVFGAGAAYVFSRDGGGVWTQQDYIKASNTEAGDNFGSSVALSADGNMLAVGAITEDSAATGVNGDQTDNTAPNSGAVYVFSRDGGGTWTQQAYVKASNTEANDIYGRAAALSADGSTLAVGAFDEASAATGVNGDQADNNAASAGAVYVYTSDSGGVWTQQAYVKASNTDAGDQFGRFRVGLSDDGNTLAVGAWAEDSAAIGVNGDDTDNTVSNSGAAYVYTRDSGGVWAQQAYVKASNAGASDQFGSAVAVSGDGSALAVGARLEDSDATGVNGDQTNNNAFESGAAYVFR